MRCLHSLTVATQEGGMVMTPLLMVMIMTLVRRQGGRPAAFLFVASFLEILDRGAKEFQISVITEVTGADNQQDRDI